jgi:hypothetical protein
MIKKIIKYNCKSFCDDNRPAWEFMDKKFEDMKKNLKPLPKRESLLLYRDSVKICRKFFWRNNDGREWAEILIKSARKEFEENRNLSDTAEVGRRLVLGRQSILELDDKILKVQHNMNKFFEETKNQQR